jgi:hypothetical protein
MTSGVESGIKKGKYSDRKKALAINSEVFEGECVV